MQNRLRVGLLFGVEVPADSRLAVLDEGSSLCLSFLYEEWKGGVAQRKLCPWHRRSSLHTIVPTDSPGGATSDVATAKLLKPFVRCTIHILTGYSQHISI